MNGGVSNFVALIEGGLSLAEEDVWLKGTSALDRLLLRGGSMNQCDVNLTVKQSARGIEGEQLGKRKGLGLTHPAEGTFLSSYFLNPGCVTGHPKKSGS